MAKAALTWASHAQNRLGDTVVLSPTFVAAFKADLKLESLRLRLQRLDIAELCLLRGVFTADQLFQTQSTYLVKHGDRFLRDMWPELHAKSQLSTLDQVWGDCCVLHAASRKLSLAPKRQIGYEPCKARQAKAIRERDGDRGADTSAEDAALTSPASSLNRSLRPLYQRASCRPSLCPSTPS